MDVHYQTKHYGLDKVALLGLFALAVLIAYLISESHRAVKLSEPIKLEHAALSVSMPNGNGWISSKQWKYQDNGFTLSSVLNPTREGAAAIAHCEYLLACPYSSPDTWFRQKAASVNGSVVQKGQICTPALTIDWAHIKNNQVLFDMFLGTAKLSCNRQFHIEVRQANDDSSLAEQVFQLITKNLKVNDNQLLRAGGQIVSQIKDVGLDHLLHNQNCQAFFLIEDKANQAIGFTMDVLVNSAPGSAPNIQAATFAYRRSPYLQEQATFFESDNKFDEFSWRSEARDIVGKTGTKVHRAKNGIMTVTRLGRWLKEKNYRPGPAAIPAVLLDFMLRRLLESDYKQIIVDIVNADGKITPAIISRFQTQENTPGRDEPRYVLELQLLDDAGFSQAVYLDRKTQVFKKILRQKKLFRLERCSLESILRLFPERSDFILHQAKMLQQEPQDS